MERLHLTLRDGAQTSAFCARYPATTRLRVVRLDPAQPIAEWAQEQGLEDVISGGFFAKPEEVPLGELRIPSAAVQYRSFARPWHTIRGCLRLGPISAAIDARDRIVLSEGDSLLQAGPLLVRDNRSVVCDTDPEGFSTTADEFDQDLTSERLPRMAIGLAADGWLAVAVNGRGDRDAGLLLSEFAEVLVELGAHSALNLDGGSSSALYAAGALRNTPRDDEGNELESGGPTTTAIVFETG